MTKIEEYLEQNKYLLCPWLEEGEQGRIEIKVLPYLKHIENGVFVEAGALDGLFMSNTKILEDLGWNGVLIEPSPLAVEKCRQNRKAFVEECALVSKGFNGSHAVGDFYFDGKDGMGAWSGIHRNLYGIKAARAVPARTLEDVLNSHNISKVDFFSLDVEGYELEVLKGVDLNKIEISNLLIEINLRDYPLSAMDTYLSQFGYKNIANLSGFNESMEGWDGSHNDYLYVKS